MRMWNIPPKVMCRKHLLGEHVEMHMFVGTIEKGTSIKGYLDNGLVNTGEIKTRHDLLAAEMVDRSYNHKSPLEQPKALIQSSVDVLANLKELARRCPECRALIQKAGLLIF